MRIRFTPWTTRSPDATAGTVALWENEFEDSLLLDNINPADFNTGIHTTFNVRDTAYGALADGSDDWAAIQAAIDAAELAGGGIVYLPAGQYSIGNVLTINAPIILRGEGRGADDTTGGEDSALSKIITLSTGSLATTSVLVTFVSPTADNVLTGCGIQQLAFSTANQRVQTVVKLSSVTHSRFEDVKMDSLSGDGCLSGFLLQSSSADITEGCAFNIFDGIQIQSTGLNCVCIHMDGETNAGGSCFQNVFRRMSLQFGKSLSTAGHGIHLDGNVDNNRFHDIQTIASPAATSAYGIYATDGATKYPRFNVCDGFNGHIYEETNCRGNNWTWATSESGSYTQQTAHITHYSVPDNTTGTRWVTKPYLVHDTKVLHSSDFQTGRNSPVITALPSTSTIHSAFGYAWAMINANETSIVAQFSAPDEWNEGSLVAVRVLWSSTVADGAWDLSTSVSADPLAAVLGTNVEVDTSSPTGATAASTTLRSASHTLALDVSKDDIISVSVARVSGDDNSGVIYIWGVELDYEADGPNTAGDWDIPSRS